MHKAVQTENPGLDLKTLVHTLSKQGFTCNEVLKFFIACKGDNQNKAEWLNIEDMARDYAVIDILDGLSGWSNPIRTVLEALV